MMSPNGPSLMQFNQELNQAMQRTAPRSGFTLSGGCAEESFVLAGLSG